jgi:two-component system sensor histidine kinase RstB
VRGSFVRLVVSSVLACWALGFVVVFMYAKGQTWTHDEARRDGVFLAYELIDQIPEVDRAERVAELRQHYSFDLTLITIDEVEHRVGRAVRPGEQIPHKSSQREEWFLMVFDDGQGALAAGPVNPAVPADAVPVGLIFAIVGLPVIAGLVALRVEHGLRKVERASQALAVGDLSARVDTANGPPDELAASFNAMAERVERLVRSRDELVQAVSHELGSPLSRLRFHMELLENQPASQRQERLAAMARELDALDELVAELLGYVQSDELKLDRQLFDPTRGLNDLAELARLELPEARTVKVDLELSDDTSVFADQRLFQRAVENILRNAVRHAQSKVLIELTQDQEHVRLAVQDDGPGIPNELREKVLIPFFRLDADRSRTTGGVGLGLAIVNRIMHRHGGRLIIDDSPLGGASIATLWPKSD